MKTTTTKLNDAARSAVIALAAARAAKLCDDAFETLRAGRKTVVKGKPVMVPFGAEKQKQLHALNRKIGAVESTLMPVAVKLFAASGLPSDEETEATYWEEALALYLDTGANIVDARFAAFTL